MNIAVTGPRTLTHEQRCMAHAHLMRLMMHEGLILHVGDADGLDKLARELALSPVVYYKNPKLPYKAQGAQRSTRMVKVLAQAGGVLYAYPNKSAPLELRPARSWPKGAEGSGTWGTVALAVGLGVRVALHPVVQGVALPDWAKVEHQQMVLT